MRILKDKEEGFARQTGWTDNRGKALYGEGLEYNWGRVGRAHWDVAAVTGRSLPMEGLDHTRLLRCYTEGCPEDWAEGPVRCV